MTDTTSYIDVPHLDNVVGHVTVTMDITQEHVSEFSVFLVSPRDELYSIMFQDLTGPGGDHFTNTTLDDDPAVYINDAEVPLTGTFRPNVSFAGLNGKSGEGRWGLRIYDGQTGAAGTINSWSIAITGEPIRASDANGVFAFDDLPAGQYHLRQLEHPTWLQTRPGAGLYNLQFSAEQNFTYAHFGNALSTSSISGVKYHDLYANAARDPGEPALAGWSVNVTGTASAASRSL